MTSRKIMTEVMRIDWLKMKLITIKIVTKNVLWLNWIIVPFLPLFSSASGFKFSSLSELISQATGNNLEIGSIKGSHRSIEKRLRARKTFRRIKSNVTRIFLKWFLVERISKRFENCIRINHFDGNNIQMIFELWNHFTGTHYWQLLGMGIQ